MYNQNHLWIIDEDYNLLNLNNGGRIFIVLLEAGYFLRYALPSGIATVEGQSEVFSFVHDISSGNEREDMIKILEEIKSTMSQHSMLINPMRL